MIFDVTKLVVVLAPVPGRVLSARTLSAVENGDFRAFHDGPIRLMSDADE
jgi:hypothetical protein